MDLSDRVGCYNFDADTILRVGPGPGPVYTASTTVLDEGTAKVAGVLAIYVRPTITPYDIAETHQNARRQEPREGTHTEEKA